MATAYLFDWIVGDPEWFPHPVRLIGRGVEKGERILRRSGQAPAVELAFGSLLTFSLVAAAYVGTAKTVAWIYRRGRFLGFITETLLAWTCLASRSLHDEASAVVASLEAGHIVLARQRLARIVGRETQHLDAHEISRAVIETVAEKLLTYALGRGLESDDKPAVRAIVRDASSQDSGAPAPSFNALIHAIVKTAPFQMRRTSET